MSKPISKPLTPSSIFSSPVLTLRGYLGEGWGHSFNSSQDNYERTISTFRHHLLCRGVPWAFCSLTPLHSSIYTPMNKFTPPLLPLTSTSPNIKLKQHYYHAAMKIHLRQIFVQNYNLHEFFQYSNHRFASRQGCASQAKFKCLISRNLSAPKLESATGVYIATSNNNFCKFKLEGC